MAQYPGSPAERLRLAGYKETAYPDGTYCNIQGTSGACGHPGGIGTPSDMNAIFTLGGTEMKLIIGSSAELGKGIDTTGQQCNVSSSCKLYGLGLGAVADVTVQVGSGSLSSGWSLGLFGAGVAVRGWEVTVGAGSDGMFGSASQARGLFFGAGVRVCEQSVSACR